MKLSIQKVLALLGVALAGQALAAPITRDFDEFASPPVTGFFLTSGVGPHVEYAELVVSSGSNARVMNGSGWREMQTSGRNLYGTQFGFIDLSFSADVQDLSLDLINGSSSGHFFVDYFDALGSLLETDHFHLAAWGEPGSVAHALGDSAAIRRAVIRTADVSPTFAIDTLRYRLEPLAVPEPGGLALAALALGLLAGARRQLTMQRRLSGTAPDRFGAER